MKVIKVINKKSAKQFLKFPIQLYCGQANWIRPLDKDIKFIFDEGQNKSFKFGNCERWVLEDDQGKVIGRIAAFYNTRTANKDNEQPTGGLGFFECIDSQPAAHLLFDTAKDWLKKNKMEAMDGPINFGDRDAWWGLLVDGFEKDPNYQCNYHFPYYRQLFESYGFQLYYKQLTFGRDVFDPVSPKLEEAGQRLIQNTAYTFQHIKVRKLEKYIEDFRTIYNNAWAGHPGVAKMTKMEAKVIMKQVKPIIDEKIIWFAYYHQDPIGFYINIPELNQIFKYFKGKLNLWNKLLYIYYTYKNRNKKMLGLVFGVAQNHQKKGVDSALILKLRDVLHGSYKKYETLEMNWIGDFNPKMIRVAQKTGGKVVKIHHTYRYLFDRNKEFKRMGLKN